MREVDHVFSPAEGGAPTAADRLFPPVFDELGEMVGEELDP